MAVAEPHEAVVQVVLVGRRRARALAWPGGRWRTAVSKIGTPRMKSGMNSGAKKKNVWPLNGCVGAAADDHRRRGHEQAEQQRAAVAHEDRAGWKL